MKTSPAGVEALIAEEGERLTAYFDIAGVPTISVGVTDGVTAADVYSKLTLTPQESRNMFMAALAPREQAVERLCTKQPTQNQFDALVSLVYNIGESAFSRSTVLRMHNAGDFDSAAKAFEMWNKAKVSGVLRVISGLVKRRYREARMYLRLPELDAQVVIEAIKPAGAVSLIQRIMQFVMKLLNRGKP